MVLRYLKGPASSCHGHSSLNHSVGPESAVGEQCKAVGQSTFPECFDVPREPLSGYFGIADLKTFCQVGVVPSIARKDYVTLTKNRVSFILLVAFRFSPQTLSTSANVHTNDPGFSLQVAAAELPFNPVSSETEGGVGGT